MEKDRNTKVSSVKCSRGRCSYDFQVKEAYSESALVKGRGRIQDSAERGINQKCRNMKKFGQPGGEL